MSTSTDSAAPKCPTHTTKSMAFTLSDNKPIWGCNTVNCKREYSYTGPSCPTHGSMKLAVTDQGDWYWGCTNDDCIEFSDLEVKPRIAPRRSAYIARSGEFPPPDREVHDDLTTIAGGFFSPEDRV
ncbi:uncharacterized protein L201_008113 [Kwoniella dendrophila CBS 6074]|uniref:Zinc finger GRF-type domain-containing protein n=1 Tax=Kwoniella dendrophila CBS 6074 TaxID=1295534 RepID=A0AAX4K630_9TREE